MTVGALGLAAALYGISVSALSWVMHFYLPGRIARASNTMGGMAFAVAALGYLFVIGRTAARSFVLNAAVWERVGSVSTYVFALPGVRRIPARSPRLRAS